MTLLAYRVGMLYLITLQMLRSFLPNIPRAMFLHPHLQTSYSLAPARLPEAANLKPFHCLLLFADILRLLHHTAWYSVHVVLLCVSAELPYLQTQFMFFLRIMNRFPLRDAVNAVSDRINNHSSTLR